MLQSCSGAQAVDLRIFRAELHGSGGTAAVHLRMASVALSGSAPANA